MKREKRVLIGIVAISILVLSVISVSADFKDWFKFGKEGGGEGELAESFEARVTLQNSPPTVLAVYAVWDTQGTATQTDVVTALQCDAADPTNNAQIDFLVQDVNGIDNLPGDASIPIRQSSSVGELGTPVCGGANCNIEVYVTNPGIEYTSANKLFDSLSCVRLPTCPNSQAGAGCALNQMEYRCSVPMEYYDEPSAVVHWSIFVGIADGSGATDDNTGLTSEENSFEYTGISEFRITDPAGGISFTGVSLSGTDQQSGNDPLVLRSCGNLDYTSGNLQGSDLMSDDVPVTGDNMPVTVFSVSVDNTVATPPAECCVSANPGGTCSTTPTANRLATTPVSVTSGGAPNLPYGRGSIPPVVGEQLYFCLWQQLNTLPLTYDNSYSSTVAKGTTPGAAGNAWVLELL